MILKTSAGDFVARFKHVPVEGGRLWEWKTLCQLKAHPTWLHAWTYSGLALCSKSDVFSRAVGRKIALQRAISQMVASKSVRSQIWQSYFAQVSPRGMTAKSVLKRPRTRQNGNGR